MRDRCGITLLQVRLELSYLLVRGMLLLHKLLEDILKVQIKSSEWNEHGNKPQNSPKYGFTLKHSQQDKAYEPHDVDFFGLVVIPLRSIWIVPQKAVDGIRKVGVWPMGNSSGAMADYREQWILLKSYSEYTEVAEPDDCHQVTFL